MLHKKSAFSLVELLVTLIILAIVTAIATPTITKKMVSKERSIGKGNFNCNDRNFMSIDVEGKKLCVTRRNMGDLIGIDPISHYPRKISDAAVRVIPTVPVEYGYTAQPECTPGESCCWIGQTANTGCTDNGIYSGCKRTVCNYNAAKILCRDFGYAGKHWRLPSTNELKYFYENSVGLGENGLMLCSMNEVGDALKCPDSYPYPAIGHAIDVTTGTRECQGVVYYAQGNSLHRSCNPNTLWSMEEITINPANVSSGEGTKHYKNVNVAALAKSLPDDIPISFVPNKWGAQPRTVDRAFSVRCVADM